MSSCWYWVIIFIRICLYLPLVYIFLLYFVSLKILVLMLNLLVCLYGFCFLSSVAQGLSYLWKHLLYFNLWFYVKDFIILKYMFSVKWLFLTLKRASFLLLFSHNDWLVDWGPGHVWRSWHMWRSENNFAGSFFQCVWPGIELRLSGWPVPLPTEPSQWTPVVLIL